MQTGTDTVKKGFASMQKGGVIMDVTSAEQAKMAEAAGAIAVMVLERVPADIRAAGGIARMADPARIKAVMAAVTIPVMAKARIGHFAEAQVLQNIGVDMVDESEVLSVADEERHIDKRAFTVPFVCGARNLGEALRRINEGAAMIRTKGEPGTGDVCQAVRHLRIMNREIAELVKMYPTLIAKKAEELRVPIELVEKVRELGRLPVVNFAAGGIATPSDASMLMQLGADGVFVGSGIFKSNIPESYAKAIVEATNQFDQPDVIARVSENLGEPMKGMERPDVRMQERGN
ncbi:pyridoxal 5'-phosphate synthase lyase subunit PdxS [Candidatus Micrarchaeota archaeon]|nr:pyridoxal 5'-phosphate synthase lyase subunit PdxS [Candidatus Micrarchaeota archaeon]